jgi:hypothetical protein
MLPNAPARRTRRSYVALVVLLAATTLAGPTPAAAAVGGTRPARGDRPEAGFAALATLVDAPAIAPGLRAEAAPDVVGKAPSPKRPTAITTIRRPRPATVSSRPTRINRTGSARAGGPTAYRGRDHVWSSDLHLDRSVSWFACSRSTPPAMAVYRWGCAGHDNVYLFAHAGGPFAGLHGVYVRGRLRRGMTVTYADGEGRVHRYRVAWWRVVLPTEGDFAFAAQSRPSMTLQTCVGRRSQYRLVVRLYQDD